MITNRRRIFLWLIIVALVCVGLWVAFWPRAIAVDIVGVQPGPMMLTVGSEGETRVKDVFIVSAPTAGRLRRIEAEPGDRVVANETVIVEIEPTEVDLLDPRSEAEARASLSAATSAEALARAEFEKAQAELGFATAEFDRAKELAKKGTISARELEAAERAFKTSRAAIGVAQAAMQVRKYELEHARAQLMSPQEVQARRSLCDCFSITSPVDGRVLRTLRESEGFVAAGEGLVEIGNPEQLEIVVDLLSIDAVKVQPGQSAIIENWGGEQPLRAQVRLVEPFGFTKTSALGIDEQRVFVVLDLVSPQVQWQRLGHGYQVDVEIILWQAEAALKIPLTALFRDQNRWAVFIQEEGRAARRYVEVGHRSASEAEILDGLTHGDAVVVYPGETIDEGVRIVARE
jgi:HlyD family secretion protein